MPKTYNMKLQKEIYNATKSGKKEWEFRLNDEKRKKLKAGDYIIFNDSLRIKVVEIRHYYCFFNAIADIKENGWIKEQYAYNLLETLNKIYDCEDEIKHNVIAIKIELVK